MDTPSYKEFAFSSDGRYVAVAQRYPVLKRQDKLCVVRVSDGHVFALSGVSFDFGHYRLAIDPVGCTLFSADSGKARVAAYDFEFGSELWQRSNFMCVASLAYDGSERVLYCHGKRAALLNVSDGRDRAFYLDLKHSFFSRDSTYAVFDAKEVKLKNRDTNESQVISRQTGSVVRAAFTSSAVLLSWVSGPVTAHDLKSGEHLWTYQPESQQVIEMATSSDDDSVWVGEFPFQEPPRGRLRLLGKDGAIEHEVRCDLGYAGIVPYLDKIIGSDLTITPIASLRTI